MKLFRANSYCNPDDPRDFIFASSTNDRLGVLPNLARGPRDGVGREASAERVVRQLMGWLSIPLLLVVLVVIGVAVVNMPPRNEMMAILCILLMIASASSLLVGAYAFYLRAKGRMRRGLLAFGMIGLPVLLIVLKSNLLDDPPAEPCEGRLVRIGRNPTRHVGLENGEKRCYVLEGDKLKPVSAEDLLDTNAVIQLLKGNSDVSTILGDADSIALSIISEMEYLSFPGLNDHDVGLCRVLKSRVRVFDVPADDEILTRMVVTARQKHGLKLPDAIIAATARKNDLTLLTADGHFKKLKSPWKVRFYRPI